MARQLGWFSIGLGLAEIIMPRKVTKFVGAGSEDRQLLRLCGVRQIATGLGMLTQGRPADWAWARIAGDVMDVACLGAAFTLPDAKRDRIAVATAVVAGVTALDWMCIQQLNGNSGKMFEGDALPVKKSVAVNRSPEDVYQFWRDFQNLSRFMTNIISVQIISETFSHWVVQAPRNDC